MKIALACLLFALSASAQTPKVQVKAVVPNSATVAVSSTVFLDGIVLTNNTASDVTVTITDRSTDCGGAACAITPGSPNPLVVKAGSVYVIALPRVEATGGISWTASAANAVIGRIVGTK